MTARISVEYSTEDVKNALLPLHTKTFGSAPVGQEWHITERYGCFIIENIAVETSVKEDEIETVVPESPF